jgi:CheY-like chemotaxis protein
MQSLTGARILVVEDEPIVALDLASILEEAGADVIGPALTLEAADKLSETPQIDVAVLDVRLGQKTVDSVADKLYGRGVPIVFHTGHGSSGWLTAQWPDSIVLIKPARTDVLVNAILTAMRKACGPLAIEA